MHTGQQFLLHEAITDTRLKIIGYQLSLSGPGPHASALIHLLRQHRADCPLEKRPLFIHADAALLAGPLLDDLAGLQLVLVLPVEMPASDDMLQHLKALKARGIRLAAEGYTATSGRAPWSDLADWIMIDAEGLGTREMRQAIGRLDRPAGQLIACGVDRQARYQASREAGIGRFLGDWYLRPEMMASKTINPGQAIILELLNQVQQDVDDAELERLFKRDATLSFRMLKYINSAGFGLFCEIESIRHAIQMLGRKELYRWLTLLLVSTGASSPPVLSTTAVIRGRFTELLGKELLGQQHMASLFIAGVFSLLDAMLAVPMAQAVDNLALAEAITDALVDRTGLYAPFLQLVELTGQTRQAPAPAAQALGLSPEQVNQAHLASLAWAESLGLV
jgi:c-di-GMP phosphodiesterase